MTYIEGVAAGNANERASPGDVDKDLLLPIPFISVLAVV
jgi:hypothetical protein